MKREALFLPLSFLTVALLGGVRVADRIVLLAPPLVSLVLLSCLSACWCGPARSRPSG